MSMKKSLLLSGRGQAAWILPFHPRSLHPRLLVNLAIALLVVIVVLVLATNVAALGMVAVVVILLVLVLSLQGPRLVDVVAPEVHSAAQISHIPVT